MSASSDGTPIARSIRSRSAASGPMWRSLKPAVVIDVGF
jgi:hypothetical protein